MKNKVNYLHLLLWLVTVPFLTVSCGGSKGEGPEPDLSPCTITSIFPTSGTPGTVITLTGKGFGTDKSKITVRVGTVESVSIMSVTNTKIQLRAPEGFSDYTANIHVTVSSSTSNTVEFYYADTVTPVITTVTTTCFYHSTVVITGKNFSPIKEENSVKFGEIEAEVTDATNTSLTVITPDLGAASSVGITVAKSGKVSNTQNISVDQDQNKVATYDWTTHTVRTGITYKTAELTLFGSLRRLHILDVALTEKNTLGIGVATPHKNTTTICNDYNAIVGINAGYFPLGSSSDKDPYIRINKETIQAGHLNVNPIFTNAALTINKNVATVRKFTDGGRNQNQLAAAIPVSEAEHVIVCGPMLITSGVIENLDMSNSHNSSSTARTGLGVVADGKRVFMVVVDYNGDVVGVSTQQLAKILQALGAVNAMNFDGGGSSTMFVKDMGDNGRVSTNTYAQRQVKSVIYVK